MSDNVLKKEFYSLRDKAIKEHDLKWIADNMEFDDAKYELINCNEVKEDTIKHELLY